MKYFLTTLFWLPLTVFAEMPYISNNLSESFERVTSGDITCESRKTQPTINTGFYSSTEDQNSLNRNNTDKGVYVALSVPLGSKNKQVDCQGLYNSALQKEQLRVKQLEMQVELLKSRQLSTD